VRLDTQEQLTAVNRFLDDSWRATGGGPGFAVVRQAFDDWSDSPTDDAWSRLREALVRTVGAETADGIIGDLGPYVGFPPSSG